MDRLLLPPALFVNRRSWDRTLALGDRDAIGRMTDVRSGLEPKVGLDARATLRASRQRPGGV